MLIENEYGETLTIPSKQPVETDFGALCGIYDSLEEMAVETEPLISTRESWARSYCGEIDVFSNAQHLLEVDWVLG